MKGPRLPGSRPRKRAPVAPEEVNRPSLPPSLIAPLMAFLESTRTRDQVADFTDRRGSTRGAGERWLDAAVKEGTVEAWGRNRRLYQLATHRGNGRRGDEPAVPVVRGRS